MKSAAIQKLSFREKAGYALGDVASNVVWQALMYFLPIFYTDVYMLPAATVATMFLVVRLFDAVNDPLMGTIADRTRSRWGKYRPYILFMAVPYGIAGMIMFTVPEMGYTGKLIYAYATYMFMMIIYTMIMIPYNALSGVMTSDHVERTSLSSYRFIGAFAGGFLIQALTLKLVAYFGAGNQVRGYQYTMGVFAVLCIFLFLLTFLSTRERIQPSADQKSTIRQDLKDLFSNKPWLMLFFVSLFTLVYAFVRNGVIMYYFKYYVGDAVIVLFGKTYSYSADNLASYFMVSGTLAIILSLFLTGWLSRIAGKKPLFLICLSIIAATAFLFRALGPDDIKLMFILQIVFSLASGPTIPLVWAMYADTADYSEWKNNRRATGLVFSAATFAQKLGITIGGALPLWWLSTTGYQPEIIQNGQTLSAIKTMMSYVPAAGALLCAFFLLLYRLDDKTLDRITAEIVDRRKNKQAE